MRKRSSSVRFPRVFLILLSSQRYSRHSLHGSLLCLVCFRPPFIPCPSSWCLFFLPFSSCSCSLLFFHDFSLALHLGWGGGLEARSFTTCASRLAKLHTDLLSLDGPFVWFPDGRSDSFFSLLFLHSLFPHSLSLSCCRQLVGEHLSQMPGIVCALTSGSLCYSSSHSKKKSSEERVF